VTGLPQHLQATLNTLHANANNDGECHMSLSELAQKRGISRRTLHRHISELETLGYLSIHSRPGQPSTYRLIPRGQGFSGITGLLRHLFQGRQGAARPAGTPAITVGREEILSTLQENVIKGRHTLLVGPLGIGKSHILRQFATEMTADGRPQTADTGSSGGGQPSAVGGRCLYLEHVSPIKPALLSLAEMLHQDGALDVEGIEARYMEWEDVRKKIAPLRVNQLAGLVTKCLVLSAERTEGMKDQNYILVLDHLERVTPAMLPHLDALMGMAVVMGAADDLKPSAQRLWWAFERVEVPPLTREQARELLWQVTDRNRVAQPQLFETRVLQQAGGNPLAIITMAGKARTAELSAQEIRGLQHGAGTRYIPLTPALMLIGAVIVAARFAALGLNDRDLYVLAGLGYAFFFVMRYFIYRID